MKARKCILFIGGNLLLQKVEFEEGEKHRIVVLLLYLAEEMPKEFGLHQKCKWSMDPSLTDEDERTGMDS